MKEKALLILLLFCRLGLSITEAQEQLLKKYPKEVEIAAQQKVLADQATQAVFGRNTKLDESDAFRHFVGAALLAKEIGPGLAREILDAHETGPGNSKAEREMDIVNNLIGLAAAEELRAQGKLNQAEIEKTALMALRNGKLKVVKRKGMPRKK